MTSFVKKKNNNIFSIKNVTAKAQHLERKKGTVQNRKSQDNQQRTFKKLVLVIFESLRSFLCTSTIFSTNVMQLTTSKTFYLKKRYHAYKFPWTFKKFTQEVQLVILEFNDINFSSYRHSPLRAENKKFGIKIK